ncbi:MAG: HDOD domain-containing protein [Gammaproteobacteria bacterium]|nr:HDOD domain-containing protein [Gammaproteobacteria bacterium]
MSAEAMQTAAGFVQELAGDLNKGDLELPMFPDSVIRIQQAFRAKEVSIDEIVLIISSDAALAARVLQLANSAAIRGSREITDVRQAIIRIGNQLVQSSAVSFALRQAEQNAGLSPDARTALKAIWGDSVELAARCYVIAKTYTKLNANEALLTGLLSVLGRLYIFMKSQNHSDIAYAELESITADWHPAISKAIAESWNMSDELIEALETQLETNPDLRESASIAEVLSSSKLILEHEQSGTPLDASEYPLLQRLGIADHGEGSVTLDAHAEAIAEIRQGLSG